MDIDLHKAAGARLVGIAEVLRSGVAIICDPGVELTLGQAVAVQEGTVAERVLLA